MTKNLTISLSIDAILERIYAISALKALLNHNQSTSVPMLSRDLRDALRLQVLDSFAHTLLRLLPHIASSNLSSLSEPTADIVSMEFLVPESTIDSVATPLRIAIENAIALDSLAICHSMGSSNMASFYQEQSDDAISTIKGLLSARPDELSIMQCWL